MNAKQPKILKAKEAKGLGGLRSAASTGPNRTEMQALTNLSGSLVASYQYDSFGNIVSITGGYGEVLTAGQLLSGAWQTHSLSHVVAANPFTYTGRELDAESGLYYYRARYYDPNSGRFLQEDPIFSENLYGYVGGNPLGFVDPFGMWSLNAGFDAGVTTPFFTGGHSEEVSRPFGNPNSQRYGYDYFGPAAGAGVSFGPYAGVDTTNNPGPPHQGDYSFDINMGPFAVSVDFDKNGNITGGGVSVSISFDFSVAIKFYQPNAPPKKRGGKKGKKRSPRPGPCTKSNKNQADPINNSRNKGAA